jgi:3-hydroxyacyl-CoA dehydrogenase
MVFNGKDAAAELAREYLCNNFIYAANRIPEIAESVVEIDNAMKWGYNHQLGPFETWDAIGVKEAVEVMKQLGKKVPKKVEEMLKGGFPSFYTKKEDGTYYYDFAKKDYVKLDESPKIIILPALKERKKIIRQNVGSSLIDIGDGVACLEFHTKMNALDEGVIRMIQKALALVDGKAYKALVVHNEAENFSVGANIGIALFAANVAAWPVIEASVAEGQQTFKALKYAPFPTVGAPSGMALGGGCEILLHCSAVQAHAESYIGLVEAGVGVVPGWGGCKEMLSRWVANPQRPGGPMPPVAKVFEMISTAKVSTSAEEARELLFLKPTDGVTMNRDRLLADAKARALALVAEGYRPPEPQPITLPGPSGRAALAMAVDGFRASGAATAHDAVVAKRLAVVLTGGDADLTEPVSEDDLSRLEREAFMDLLKTPATLARIEHMLETGKPLRN